MYGYRMYEYLTSLFSQQRTQAPADMSWASVFEAVDWSRHLSSTNRSQVYMFLDGKRVYKSGPNEREYEFLLTAGEHIAVKVLGRSIQIDECAKEWMTGFIMELATPLDPSLISVVEPREKKWDLTQQMISAVRELHEGAGIVHGDIKPANFLLCGENQDQVRLSDFGESRWVDEDVPEGSWKGFSTTPYNSPARMRNWPNDSGPVPTVEDDLYSLGMSIWELWAGSVPFTAWDTADILMTVQQGGTVEVNATGDDEEVKNVVRELLRTGGANV